MTLSIKPYSTSIHLLIIFLLSLIFISCSSSSYLYEKAPVVASFDPIPIPKPLPVPVVVMSELGPKPPPSHVVMPVPLPEAAEIHTLSMKPSPPSTAVKTSVPPVYETPSSSTDGSLKNTKSSFSVSHTVPEKPVDGLLPGKVAWNIPGPIKVNTEATIEVKLTLDPERFAGLANRVKSKGFIKTDNGNFSNNLTATLVALDEVIKITPDRPRRQDVIKGRDAHWIWHVLPKQAGPHELTLTIESHIGDKVTSESFTRQILVNALPPPSLLEKTLAFIIEERSMLITAILLPFSIWLFNIYLKRRRQKKLS